MKKTLLTKKILTLSIALFVLLQMSVGQALLVEDFDYPVGNLPVSPSSIWSSVNTGTAVQVTSGSLSYTGYVPDMGNSITMLTGLDYKTPILSVSSGAVYAAFLINVTTASVAGDYFFHFMESTSSTYYKGRVWIKQGSTTSKILFGVAKSGTTPAVSYSTDEFDIGTTYLIVLKYQINTSTTTDDIVTLYVNPTLASEPASPTITASDNSTTDGLSISLAALRQGGATSGPSITFDGLRVTSNWTDAVSDINPPVPSFSPANSAVNVAVNITPTITFNEPILKTDGSAVADGDLTSLIIFKKTDATGDIVPFSASIDATKKVITITPSSALDNSQIYYLALGAVEDASGNQSTGSTITFTTLAAATPTITLTYPAGGEVMYAGQSAKITWTSENVTNVFIEVYGPDNDITRVFGWTSFIPTTSASAGTVDIIVPADAPYGTVYRIRISDIDNPSVVSTGGDFTVISVATSLPELRTGFTEGYIKVNDIVKLSSEIIITFKAPSSNIYAQDAGAGILIYDSGGKMTGYNEKDGVTGLTGTIATYNNILEIIPNASPGAATSTNNTMIPVILTAASLNTNYDTYESMLIKINEVTFADAGVTFASGASYNITDVSGTTVFYTKFSSANYISTTIPSGLRNVTGICLQYNTTGEIASRNLLDFEVATGIERKSDLQAEIYPVPATSELKVRNILNVKSINILDMTGKVIRTTNAGTENEITIPVSDLRSGIYFIRFNTNNGSVIKRFIK